MSDEVERALRGYDTGLDNVSRASGRMRNELFFNQVQGATNLLHKAMSALETGDTQRVDRLVDRLAAMDYDDREECFVGVRAATQCCTTRSSTPTWSATRTTRPGSTPHSWRWTG